MAAMEGERTPNEWLMLSGRGMIHEFHREDKNALGPLERLAVQIVAAVVVSALTVGARHIF